MSFSVISPPKDEERFAALGKEILDASAALGLTIEPEGFLRAWLTGTRVVVERDQTNAIVSIAFLITGMRWAAAEVSASVLEYAGNEAEILEFTKTIAQAMGVQSFMYEEKEKIDQTDEGCKRVVRELYME